MRQVKWLVVFLVIALLLTLTGCGQKDEGDIVKDLEKAYADLGSYKAVGEMKVLSNNTPQTYSVEVWYKQPHYYRFLLTNIETNVTQIVLRNDDGVFVLDPALNRSYRFKSDWPESNGAVYLYQSLADSVINDSERTFTADGDLYLFEVKANYQNQTLDKQKVWWDKNLNPVRVEVYDSNQTQLVEMVYTEFVYGAEFDDDAFDMERNLTGWDENSLPTIVYDQSDSFGFIEPSYIPEGVTKGTPKFVEDEDGKAVVIKYSGEYNYSLVETRPKTTVMASAPDLSKTELVDLGFGLGILTELTETRSLSWTYDGIDFQLTGDLPTEEMVSVAKSVFGQAGK